MKIELGKIAAETAAQGDSLLAMMGDMFKQTILPDGTAEMVMTTDGESGRTELRGRWSMMPSGSVMLSRGGDSNSYVLNPAEKTYYVVKPDAVKMPDLPGGLTLPKPEVTVKPTGTFETIVGHRAERIDVSWRMALPVPEGTDLPPGVPTSVDLQLEQWCAPDVKGPTAERALAVGAMAKMLPGMGFEELLQSCSFPLRSRMRMSLMPGYELLMSVTSITDVSPAPDAFAIPTGYKEVPMPMPKLPGIGG